MEYQQIGFGNAARQFEDAKGVRGETARTEAGMTEDLSRTAPVAENQVSFSSCNNSIK